LIHVDELVGVLLAAADRGQRLSRDADGEERSRGIYFAASGEEATFKEFGRMIAQAVNRPRALMLPVPTPFVWATASGAELLQRITRRTFPFGFDKAREATAGSWVCSVERIQSEFGFQPKLSLAERIRATAEWYLEQGWI
jgi:nucleoside-diphosphate-sugar epimerase